jgi:LAO/AO transport system kinase
LEALLSLATREDNWQPPIVKTVATENKGTEDLALVIDRYREFQGSASDASGRRQAIARWRIVELLQECLLAKALSGKFASEALDRLAIEVAAKRRDPYSAVEELMEQKIERTPALPQL